MVRGGVFGPSLSGKTTLVQQLGIEYWAREQRRSLVHTATQEQWGPYFWQCSDPDLYWATLWRMKNCLAIVEEAGINVDRDNDLSPVFTTMRHNGHKLLVIGHSGTDILPKMRQQLDCVWLFCQPPQAAKAWAENFPRYYREVMDCWQLDQHEFLFVRQWYPPVRARLFIEGKTLPGPRADPLQLSDSRPAAADRLITDSNG